MRILFGNQFVKSSEKLPNLIQSKLDRLVELLKKNPYHPSLHTKKLGGILAGYLSFRVTRDYRVVFYFENIKTIHLLKVKHRKDIYR